MRKLILLLALSGLAYGQTAIAPPAPITQVTAGTGLAGGGTSGNVTLAIATPFSVPGTQSIITFPETSCSGGVFGYDMLCGSSTFGGLATSPDGATFVPVFWGYGSYVAGDVLVFQNNSGGTGAGAVVDGGTALSTIYTISQPPGSDILCAHRGDTSETFSYGATACNNSSTDATGTLQYFATQPTMAANSLGSGNILRVTVQFGVWSSAGSVPNIAIALYWGSTQVWYNGTNVFVAGVSNYGLLFQFIITGNAAASASSNITVDDLTTGPWNGSSVSNHDAQPVAVTTNSSEPLKFATYWESSSGLNTATYSSGGSFSGTGTCTLGSFSSGTGAAATIAVSSGTPGAITVTNTGYGLSGTSGTATVSTGTGATCSGTVNLTWTLGGAQGNALQLRNVIVEKLH